tara:strand:+ start:2583 stop:3548 length:966 start_codon:yes stop_codon:yes gene_type:complete
MKSKREIKKIAQKCISIEVDEAKNLINKIDDNFVDVVNVLYQTRGRVIITAIGKSANISNKIVATLNSTGTPAIFVHAAEALHGDLGVINREDTIICISNSGNTNEIKLLISQIRSLSNKLIAITGNSSSFLAKQADYVLDVGVEKEACINNLAPTSSTTNQLIIGDAIAVALLYCNGFTKKDFAKYHPGGTLGKRISISLEDLVSESNFVTVNHNDSLQKVIFEISNKCKGATAVVKNKNLLGIITDGDLRRMLQRTSDITKIKAKDIMSSNPKTLDKKVLAYDGLLYMQKNKINQIIVTSNTDYIGIVHINEILKQELV